MARQQRDIASYVGETAVWRQYVSAAAYDPSGAAAGGGQTLSYAPRVVTGLFAPVSLDEIMQAGGMLLNGDMRATFVDANPGTDDTMIWRGVAYRVVADPIPQRILGSSAPRFIMRRGQPTGG